MLEVKNLSVTYNGNIKALKKVNINVSKGELVVLIGANGAGKTTLLKALTGLVRVDSGSFANLDLTGLTDKRTLNRFCGSKTTDKLLAVFETSEKVFEFLQRAEGENEVVPGFTPAQINKLKAKYHKYSTANLLKIPAFCFLLSSSRGNLSKTSFKSSLIFVILCRLYAPISKFS